MSLAQSPQSSAISSKLLVTQACDDGVKFAQLFYKTLDKERHTMAKLFHDNATLLWNGNPMQGKANVISFYEKLPSIETQLHSIDAQPILDVSVGAQMICVKCCGRMKFASTKEPPKNFTESFMLTAENNVWKVVADTYRNY